MSTAEVLKRIREGANVPVAPLAQVIGCSKNHLWQQIREEKIEAVSIGRSVFVPARVAGPLVGIKPEPQALAA